jgi:hypothetical protein
MIPAASTANSIQNGTAAIGIISRQSPYIFAYPFSQTGAGAKSANPASIPSTSAGGGVGWGNLDGSTLPVLFSATTTTPFVNAYPWSTATGSIGTKYTDPGTLATAAYGIKNFDSGPGSNPQCTAVATNATPYIHAYEMTSSGWGTKVSNPGTLPTGNAWDVEATPSTANTQYVGVVHNTTPFISVYEFGSTKPISFVSKITNPGTLPSTTGGGSLLFNGDNSALAIASGTTPFIHAYAITKTGPGVSLSFGTKASDPGSLPSSSSWALDFTKNESHIGVVHDTSPFVSIYPWTNGSPPVLGTKIANPSTLPGGNGYGIAFTPDSLVLAWGSGVSSANVGIYDWDGSTVGTKKANLSSGPTDNAYAVSYKTIAKVSN